MATILVSGCEAAWLPGRSFSTKNPSFSYTQPDKINIDAMPGFIDHLTCMYIYYWHLHNKYMFLLMSICKTIKQKE